MKDINWNNKKIIGKGKQKAYHIEKDEEQLDLDEKIDHYDINGYEKENEVFNKEQNTNFIISIYFSIKPISDSIYHTCFAHFTSDNKLHHHFHKDNCKYNI